MIKKKYFPQQDTPSRVKNDIINKLHQTPKKVRLMYMFKYKLIIPALLFIAILGIGYVNIYTPRNTLVAENNKTSTIEIQTTAANEITLQQELNKAEIALTQLSDNLNEEDISL